MNEATKALINETGKPKTKPSSQSLSAVKTGTVDDLKAQFDTARATESWKDVSRLAREISKAERYEVQARKDALLKQTLFLQGCFRNAIENAIQEVCDNLSKEELELVEGIWLTKDFAEEKTDVRIVRDRINGRAKKS